MKAAPVKPLDEREPAAAQAAHESAPARVQRLAARDAFMRECGISLVHAGSGSASVRMTVGASHLNFHGTCHGGAIFALADAAFGLASNSHGPLAAGIDAHIAYHAAAREGDVLTAEALETSRTRRLAVYRIDVTRADAARIASFTGTVYVAARSHAGGADDDTGSRLSPG